MSTCARMRQALLEADPEQLLGLGDTALARHVRECARCARIAQVLLHDTAALSAYLEQEAEPDVARILERAGRHGGTRGPLAGTERVRRLTRPAGWASIALAAGLAGLLFVTRERGPSLPPSPTAVARASQPARPVVSNPGRDMAIIETDNPDITVIWFF